MRTIQRDIIGAFIFSADGKMVIGQNAKGGVYTDAWLIPGGGIEKGESELDALIREVSEEVGLDISSADKERIEGTHSGKSEKTLRETGERVIVEMIFNDYIVRLSSKAEDTQLIDGDGFTNVRWLSVSEFGSTNFAPGTATTLQKIGLLPSADV